MSLVEAVKSQSVRIVNINDDDVAKELYNLGIDVYDVLHLEQKALLNDPIQFTCNNGIFSISKKEAKQIEVKVC